MKRFADYLSLQLLRRIEIRYRLIGSFLLVSLLPLGISGYLAYVESNRAIVERTRLFSSEVVKQVSKNIGLEMGKLEADSERLVLSDRVQAALAQYGGENQSARAAARADLTRVLLERYGSFDYVNQKYFLDAENRIVDTQVFAALGRGIVNLVERAPALHGRPYWGAYGNPAGQGSMVLLRAIYNKDNNKLAGSLVLGIRPSHFASIFDDVELGGGGDMLVLDVDDARVLAKARDGRDAPADSALVEAIRQQMLANRYTGFARIDAAYMAAWAPVAGTSWFVVSRIAQDQLSAAADSVRKQIMLVGVMCLALSILLAVILARSISRPLDALVRSMRETESGNYAGRMQAEGGDELTVLAHKFNEMASKVDRHQMQLEERVDERTRDLAEANAKLETLSMTDGLTGIANRRRFDQQLEAELARGARSDAPLALLMLDIDYFKNYNDHYGHQMGDSGLRSVARLLQSHARRAGDLAARYGGEEFVLLAADTDAPTALALAEQIRQALAGQCLAHAGSPLGWLSVSIGVAVRVPHGQLGAADLLGMADQAMYRAKQQGRNQVTLADGPAHGTELCESLYSAPSTTEKNST
ncbi:MAG: diguanylate cyclase [Pseudomonadota bacterium]